MFARQAVAGTASDLTNLHYCLQPRLGVNFLYGGGPHPSRCPPTGSERCLLRKCGGERSAALGAYYAGPGNSFWPTLHSVGLTPRLLAPSEFRTLPSYGIGLTDIAKFRAGADSILVAGDFDVASFCDKIEQFAPRAIAFNGKKAASVFFGCGTRDVSIGLQSTQIGGTQVWVLPSTSGSARGFWDTRPWQGLAKSLRE